MLFLPDRSAIGSDASRVKTAIYIEGMIQSQNAGRAEGDGPRVSQAKTEGLVDFAGVLGGGLVPIFKGDDARVSQAKTHGLVDFAWVPASKRRGGG